MQTWIALFRGINVGGKNTLPMSELNEILSSLGANDIKTYIQSGNVVFKGDNFDAVELSGKISEEVNRRKGFAPQVMILTTEELNRAIVENPFQEVKPDDNNLHLGFLATPVENVDLQNLESLKAPSEQFCLSQSVFYLYAPEGVGRSKLAAGVERSLRVTMTDRNWRTVCKLRDLASGF